MRRDLHPQIQQRLARIDREASAERLKALEELAQAIAARLGDAAEAELVFVCTHNSRRSHFAEVWARAAAIREGLEGIRSSSAGTEVTACNPRTVSALRRAGVEVEMLEAGENPVYGIRLGAGLEQHRAFSKLLDDPSLSKEGHIAVMTCSSADTACPFIPGASARIALPFVDPKVADDTPEEAATYDLRSHQIATEMVLVMTRVRELIQEG